MKFMFKKLLVPASLVALAVSAVLPQMATAADVTKWRVQSHWPSASSSYKDSLVRLKNQIEQRTEGRLELQLFESGALSS